MYGFISQHSLQNYSLRMKVALLVALATIATVSSNRSPTHSAVYKPGEQYVYHYKGQILNGIPKSSKQFSGLILDSLVMLQFQQDYRVVMKLNNIKLYKIDDQITNSPAESLPESEMIRVTGEQEKVLIEKLVLPVKFRYEEGEIRELQKETRDKYWSVNIKKGILSIFQVTLKEKHSLSSDSSIYYDPTMSRIKSYGARSYGSSIPYWNPTTKTNTVYTVKETDVSGNCETKYTIVNGNTQSSPVSTTMFVTAVRNFDTCLTRPFNVEGLFQGVPTSSSERELIQPTVHTDYVITGDRTHFLIKEATRRGKYIVFINGLEGGDLSSYVFQKLTLKEAVSIRSPVHLVSPRTDHRGLQMIMPKANLLPEKEQYNKPSSRYDSYVYQKKYGLEYELKKNYESEEYASEEEEEPINENDIVPVIERKLLELTECVYTTTTTRKCTDILMEITIMMREATKTQLKTLYERHIKTVQSGPEDTQYRLSEILLDILPTLSTPEGGEVLIELIREKRITPMRGSLLINTMSVINKPNPTVIKQLLEMFKEMNKITTANTINGQAMLRQSTLLAVGTLVNRLLVVMRSQGKPIPELITFVDTISLEMKRMAEESTGSEKILVLKAMGNMGASDNIMVLKNIIENKVQRQDHEIRINAIYALRRVAKEFKKQVIPILMGVFMDEKEDRLIRQAAFMVIIKANPTYATLQMIAHRTSYDKCQQTKALVYSNLINLAFYTSHQPEHKQLIKNSRLVLKTMIPVHVGFYDSMSLFTSHFSEKYDMGVSVDMTKLKSKTSGFPDAIKTSLEATLFGKHRRFLEVGAEGKAYTVLLRKIFGPHGLLSQVLKGKISLDDVLKTFGKVNLGGVEQKIIEIMNKMRMELPTDEDMFANWYLKFFGNELQYITLNSHNVEEFISNVNRWIVDKIMQLSSGTTFDWIKAGTHRASLSVATTFGVPLHLNHTMYTILKLEGSVKVNNLPTDLSSVWQQYKRFSLTEGVEQLRLQFPFNIPDIKFEFDVKPFVDVSKYITFTSDMRWLMAGVGTEAYLRAAKPFRLTGELNKPQHSLSFKYYPTKQTMPMLHTRAVPIIFVNYMPTTVNKLPYVLEIKELKNEEIMKKYQFGYTMRSTMTGQEFTMTGVYSLCGPRWCPIMPLFGKQELIVNTKPLTSENVDYVELKFTALRNNFEYEGIPAHLPTEELYEQYEQEYYDKETMNYRTASRRSALMTDDFEPVSVDPAFEGETPIKRQLRVILRPSNRQVPTLKGQFTWYMSKTSFLYENIKNWVNQLNTQIIRSVHDDTTSWKLVLDTVINPKAWSPVEQYREFKEYLLKSEMLFNINGNVKNMKLKITPGSPIDFETVLNRHMLWPIYDKPEPRTLKHKYTAELTFPELTDSVKKGLIVINDAMKYYLYEKLVAELPESPMESNKLIVSVELLPKWEKMHIIVKNPRENLYIADVPFYLNPFQLTNEKVKLHNQYAWDFYKRFDDSELSADSLDLLPFLPQHQYTPLLTKGECKIEFDKGLASTFDGTKISIKSTIVKMQQEGCGVLFAQDCRKDGTFSVYVSGTGRTNWSSKLHLPHADIKITAIDRVARFEINGQVITLRPSQVYSIPSVLDSTGVMPIVEFVSSEEIVVKAKELGLTVRFDKSTGTVDIYVSHGSMLWGNICGLCGNNNQDPSDDLEVPSFLRTPSPRPFYLSHLIPSSTCNVDTPIVDAEYCKKTTTLTLRRYENDVPMTCTSEKKVIQCAEGCRPAQIRSVKTCFRCQSESGQSLPRTSYYDQQSSMLDLEDSSLNCTEFSERIEVPSVCEPIY